MVFVGAMRLLDGQIHSYDRARALGILPGSRTVDKRKIKQIHNDLIRGLCLLEGCLPLSHLNPAMHHFVHYATYTETHGCLRLYWMMCFERYPDPSTHPTHTHTPPLTLTLTPAVVRACRYNKYVKNLVRDVSHPESHLANSHNQDISAKYYELATAKYGYDIAQDPRHNCVLSVQQASYYPSHRELADLRMLGVALDCYSVTAYSVAHIMGVHFRAGVRVVGYDYTQLLTHPHPLTPSCMCVFCAGEWGKRPRCGSIIVGVFDGRSLYGRVERFLQVEDDACPGYASVCWFGEPEYPSGTPLVVRVHDDGSEVDSEIGSVVKITQIDPSRVLVECPVEGGTDYYVMRVSGVDTCSTD